ncbi:MAG TPA: DUF447 domain-containing protein [Methylophilus sp.]
MIFETIITTVDLEGNAHVSPFGIRQQEGFVIIAPYKPSTTLQNILTTNYAVMNLSDDVRIFAGAVARKQHYELVATKSVNGYRLANTLAHQELILDKVIYDELRPELWMRVVYAENHQPFAGFNRAQAAVIELAVLASRLAMLPQEKVIAEMRYLQIAIDKTAGEHELQAWQWLVEMVDNFYAAQAGQNQA